MSERNLPLLLALALGLLIVWSGIDPHARDVWVAEIVPVLLIFGGLLWLYPRFRFSNAAYLLMSAWLFWHRAIVKSGVQLPRSYPENDLLLVRHP